MNTSVPASTLVRYFDELRAAVRPQMVEEVPEIERGRGGV
jgi:hypothetical protein